MEDWQVRAALDRHWAASDANDFAGEHEIYRDQGDMRGWIESVTPMGRVGTVEKIARPVLFLASDAAAYVTGETLHVTGGLR